TLAAGLPAVPTQVVPPGGDVAPAPGGPPEDLRRGRRVALLCVGNWVERKGTLDALEALALTPPDAATLHLVGRTDVDPRSPAPGGPPADLRRGRRVALLCVGNWVERKGTLDLLEALALLPPDAAALHLVGRTDVDPRYAARVERRVARGDPAGRVVVHGPVARERVAQLYRSADVFVLPSYREPYGTVYGEAMAAGLPVVGWRAGNLPNLARDG